MEIFKILLPIITTFLGAGLSYLAIEAKTSKDQLRLLDKESTDRKNRAIAATAEVLLLAVGGQVSGTLAKKKVIEIYASNFMLLENGFYKQTIECFDNQDNILSGPVENWINEKNR